MIPPLYFDPTEPTVFYRKLEVGETIRDEDRGITRSDVPKGGGSVNLTHKTICDGCPVTSSDGNFYFRRVHLVTYFDPTEPTIIYRRLEVGETIVEGDRAYLKSRVPKGGGKVNLSVKTLIDGELVKETSRNDYFRRITPEPPIPEPPKPEPPKPEPPSILNELFDLWFIKYSPICVDEDERRVWERAIKAMSSPEK